MKVVSHSFTREYLCWLDLFSDHLLIKNKLESVAPKLPCSFVGSFFSPSWAFIQKLRLSLFLLDAGQNLNMVSNTSGFLLFWVASLLLPCDLSAMWLTSRLNWNGMFFFLPYSSPLQLAAKIYSLLALGCGLFFFKSGMKLFLNALPTHPAKDVCEKDLDFFLERLVLGHFMESDIKVIMKSFNN